MIVVIILIIIALILYKLYTIDCDKNEYINYKEYMQSSSETPNESPCNIASAYNNDQFTVSNATITQMLTANAFNLLPTGMIAAWNGTVIPNGWVLCDGTNGTPDLRNKFIIGASAAGTSETIAYAIGATGGASTVTLSAANMPPHTHSYNLADNGSNAITNIVGTVTGKGNFYNGTTTSNTGSTGGGQSFSILPPYYALVYIMKT